MRDVLTLLGSGIRNSYSALFFSRDSWVGLALFLVTMLYPSSGLCGLFCCVTVNVLAIALSLDRFKVTNGLFGFNAVIVGVAVGSLFPVTLPLLGLLFALSIMILLLIAGWDALLSKYHLPYLVFPFLICLWTVLLLSQQRDGDFLFDCVFDGYGSMLPLNSPFLSCLSENDFWITLPEWLTNYFLGLSCVLFRQDVMFGFLLAVILLCYSRIAFLYTFVNHLFAYFLFVKLGGDLFHLPYVCFGFNFILTSLALGCSYLVPSFGSFLWTILLVPVQFVVVYASTRLLNYFFLPTFSLAFCLVSILSLVMLKMRTSLKSPFFSSFLERNPEENLYQFQTGVRRFKWYNYHHFDLPFYGAWKVSQGAHGVYTHKDAWADAWDFVVEMDGKQFGGDGSLVTDYYCYGKPVLAPADGCVVALLNEVDDNPVGQCNEKQNWGNYVVVKHADGLYSLLAHLKRDSFFCQLGQCVKKGDELALCGNTGLSPFPHLHFQFQAYPFAGAPTLCYPFVNYMELTSGGNVFHSCDIPAEGVSLCNMNHNSSSIYASFFPGAKFSYVFDSMGEGGWSVQEEYGYRFLLDSKTHSKAWFSYKDGVFEFQRYEGGSHEALYYFFLSNFKMIDRDVDGWRLTDEVPLSVRRAGFLGYVQDFFAPFFSFTNNRFVASKEVGANGFSSSVSTEIFGRKNRLIRFVTKNDGAKSLIISVAEAKRTMEIRIIAE